MSSILSILRSQRLQKPFSGLDVLSIPNLQAWYDASDPANTIVSAGAITQWKDKSGKGRHLSATDNNMPLYSASGGANGLPYISLDGSHSMKLTTTFDGPLIVYALFRMTDLTNNPVSGQTNKSIITFNNSATAGLLADIIASSTNLVPITRMFGSYYSIMYKNSSNTNWQVAVCDMLTVNIGFRINNEPAGNTMINPASFTITPTAINFGYLGFGASCQLSEVIIVANSITQANDNAIREYLLAKSNIQPKPQIHIFGDSLSTNGSGNFNAYMYLVSNELGMDLVNWGHGGTIVFPVNGSTGVAGYNFDDVYNQELAYGSYEGQWLILFFGVNDSNQGGIKSSNTTAQNLAWQNGYQSRIQTFITGGVPANRIILVKPPAKTTTASTRTALNAAIDSIAANLGVHLCDLYAIFNATGDPDSLFLDDLHPNDAGNRLEADSFKAIITA